MGSSCNAQLLPDAFKVAAYIGYKNPDQAAGVRGGITSHATMTTESVQRLAMSVSTSSVRLQPTINVDILLYKDLGAYEWVVAALQRRLDQEPGPRVNLRRVVSVVPTAHKEVPLWVVVCAVSTVRPESKITSAMDHELNGIALSRGTYHACTCMCSITNTTGFIADNTSALILRRGQIENAPANRPTSLLEMYDQVVWIGVTSNKDTDVLTSEEGMTGPSIRTLLRSAVKSGHRRTHPPPL